VFEVVVVFVVERETLPFVVVVVFDVLVVVFVFDIIGVAVAVAVGDGEALAGRFVALFAGAASPQAIPKAPRANTDESAIAFFITNSSLLSSSKNNTNLF
jgi:hypothetical protein